MEPPKSNVNPSAGADGAAQPATTSNPATDAKGTSSSTSQVNSLGKDLPIVLGLLHEGEERRSDLHPCWMNPGPHLRENSKVDEETPAYMFCVPGSVTHNQKGKLLEVQFFVYLIASRCRYDILEEAELAQERFIKEVRVEWDAWVTGEIADVQYQERVDVITMDACESFGCSDFYTEFMSWKYAARDANNMLKPLEVSKAESRGNASRLPSTHDQNVMQRLVKYGWKASAVLARLTEDEEHAKRLARTFRSEANRLYRGFLRGLIPDRLCVVAINLLFKASCPAAADLTLSEEVELERRAAYGEI